MYVMYITDHVFTIVWAIIYSIIVYKTGIPGIVWYNRYTVPILSA